MCARAEAAAGARLLDFEAAAGRALDSGTALGGADAELAAAAGTGAGAGDGAGAGAA